MVIDYLKQRRMTLKHTPTVTVHTNTIKFGGIGEIDSWYFTTISNCVSNFTDTSKI